MFRATHSGDASDICALEPEEPSLSAQVGQGSTEEIQIPKGMQPSLDSKPSFKGIQHLWSHLTDQDLAEVWQIKVASRMKLGKMFKDI